MSYVFNPFTSNLDRVIDAIATVVNYIDTIFSSDIIVPATKVLILKDPILNGADIILDGELYLL